MPTAMTAACPECEAQVPLSTDVETGEIVQCPDCGVELEVTARQPAELRVAPKEEEDWGE